MVASYLKMQLVYDLDNLVSKVLGYGVEACLCQCFSKWLRDKCILSVVVDPPVLVLPCLASALWDVSFPKVEHRPGQVFSLQFILHLKAEKMEDFSGTSLLGVLDIWFRYRSAVSVWVGRVPAGDERLDVLPWFPGGDGRRIPSPLDFNLLNSVFFPDSEQSLHSQHRVLQMEATLNQVTQSLPQLELVPKN